MRRSGRLRNMASLYLLQGNRILLLYRQGNSIVKDMWVGSAGGHFEPFELNDPMACVLRELKEELDLTEDAIENLQLRYATMRDMDGQIRQNYYFFADLKNGFCEKLSSTEGILQWFSLNELQGLKMPFTARYVIDHYFATGRFDAKLYGGIGNDRGVIFIEM